AGSAGRACARSVGRSAGKAYSQAGMKADAIPSFMSSNSKADPKRASLKNLPKTLLKSVASGLGFEVRRKSAVQPSTSPKLPNELDVAYRLVENHTLVAREGLESLYDQVVFC